MSKHHAPGSCVIDSRNGEAVVNNSTSELGLFESVIQTVRGPLLVLDPALQVAFANSAFVQRFSSDGSPTGQSLFDLCGGIFDLPELRYLIDETLANASAFEDIELVVPEEGSPRVFVMNGRIVEERAGEQLFLLALEDVTAQRFVATQADELTLELELHVALRTAELEAFSYSVSHDLRAPLRTIAGFAGILAHEHAQALSPEGVRYLGLIRAGAEQMGQLIDGLLAFSRLGRQELSKRPVAMLSLFQAVLAQHVDEIAERKIAIEIHALPVVQCDPLLLQQVLANLVDNALKYTRHVDGPRVEIGAERHGRETTFFVRDNGVGFDPSFAGNLFGVFHRLHRAEDYEGTGVGLALTKRVVERHGGRIWAEAEEGVGATFFFTLGAAAG